MEKRYIDLIHELQDCETARNFVLARAEAAEADARECRAERARYGDAMTARLAGVEAERDTIRAELCFNRALVAKAGDDINRLLKDTLELEAERDAARALALRIHQKHNKYTLTHKQLSCGHPAAFIAAPAGCDPRCELCAVRAERDALRERCIEWLPFNEAAETIDSILVWREDAGVFVAFYADEQECWFTSFGEDLTGDLPTFYAKMPKGPTSK